MTVAIITDSTADLPSELADSLGIHVVPLNVMFGNEAFLDGVTIKSDEFYRRLESGDVFPTTSQPAAGVFLEKYREVAASSDEIISIHISEGLSKTINSARHARQEFGEGGARIEVVDSRQVGMGLGLVVLAVARAARDGLDLSALTTMARSLVDSAHIYFLVDTLEYLRRGGRIGRAQAFLGSILRIHPILTIEDGVVEPLERARSRRKGLARLRALVEAAGPASAVATCSAGVPELARELADLLKALAPGGEVIMADVGPVVGAHGGPGLIGVAFISERPA